MSYADNPYRASANTIAGFAAADERADFIRKTYAHLAGAVFAFAALETVLLHLPGIGNLALSLTQGYNWLIVLGAFMVVAYLADKWAHSAASPTTQYVGLGLYVAAEALIFLPLLYYASVLDAKVIPTAGLATLTMFGGLTAIVLFTRADFSFLRTALWLAGFVAGGFILCSIFIGFSLGVVFTAAMIAFAGGYILYYTSNVLHHYRIGQHVAASLALFASVALLFWYMVQLAMALSSRD